MQESEHSKLVHWDNPERRDGMGRQAGEVSGWGTHIQPLLTHVKYGKNHHNIVK